ncbi:MAG: TonB-dependent receptor [Bacteroidota bacterium]|nr:TonB-dependent receptor [Bacteroidota bacterium]
MKTSIAVVCLFISLNTFSQNKITGKITDAKTHAPLQSVTVYLPEIKAGAISDRNGLYSFKNIPSGNYLVEASLVGFTTQAQNINLNENKNVDFNLYSFTETLPEVIQTETSGAIELQKTPLQVGYISKTQLLQNSYTNITDAIANIPGVSQTTEGQSISKPFIRGLGYNRVVVINDGVKQEGQQWFDEFGIEADEDGIEGAEVLKGPGSLRYGSDAIAGVINYLGPKTLPDGKIQLHLLSEYQTNSGLYNNSINLAGNQKGFIWDLRYSNKEAHDYKNKYDGYVWNSGMAQNAFRGIIGLNKKWGYSHLTVSLFDLKLGVIEGARDSATGLFTTHYLDSNGGDSMDIAPSSDYKKYNYFPIIHQHIRHYKAVLDNNFLIGKSQLQVTLGLQQNYRQEANDITVGNIYNNYFFSQTFTYDAQLVLPQKNNWQVSAGINGMDKYSQDRGLVFLIPEYNAFDFGVFSLARKTIKKLIISGGLRYDVRHLQTRDLYVNDDGERVSKSEPGSEAQFNAFTSNFSGFSGSIGGVYDFTKNIYGKINFSRGYRAPAINESGANGIHDGTPFFEIGDAHLKAENSFQADITLGIKSKNITAEIDVYRNEINNYIFPQKLASVFGGDSLRTDVAAHLEGPAFRYIAGDAVISGIEAILDIHPDAVPWLHFENSISMIRAIQKHQPDSTKYLPYTPPGRIQSRLRFVIDNSSTALHNTYFFIGINDVFKQDKIYYKYGDETVTPGYTLLNAGLGSDIFGKNGKLFSIYISGNNLTDKAYQSNLSLLKYGDPNNVTGRIGVYNMGRNFTFKVLIPIDLKK